MTISIYLATEKTIKCIAQGFGHIANQQECRLHGGIVELSTEEAETQTEAKNRYNQATLSEKSFCDCQCLQRKTDIISDTQKVRQSGSSRDPATSGVLIR